VFPRVLETILNIFSFNSISTIRLAILSNNSGAGLWNCRDYEPYGDSTRHAISAEDLQEFLNR
jgi:hypothetical protein